MAKDTYLVKEMFGPTLQGEGVWAGSPCVFLRFAVCNLQCTWCDTDFSPGDARHLRADEIVEALLALDIHQSRRVIVTGGEPMLQWDDILADKLHAAGFTIHMESNGTHMLKAPVDWLTISPKPQFHEGRFHLSATHSPNECKVVVDDTVDAEILAGYEARYPQAQWFVQPCMDDRYDQHLAKVMTLVHARRGWKVSLQLHKILAIP